MSKLTIRDVLLEAIETQPELDRLNKEVEVLNEGRKEVKGAVSEHLFTVAKAFGVDHERFNLACKAETDWAKSEEAGKHKVDKIPRCFIQAKSNIIAAMKEGLDPNAYKSESDLRAAKVEAKKANNEGETHTFDGQSPIAIALQGLVETLHSVTAEQEAQVVAFLQHVTADLRVMLAIGVEQEGTKEDTKEVEQEAPKKRRSRARRAAA